MKKIYLVIALSVCSGIAFAQSDWKRSYFGIKTGVNISKINFDPVPNGFDVKDKTSFAGGIYYNIGIGKIFSIRPEVLYSVMGANVIQTLANPISEGKFKLEYVSFPILLQLNFGRFGIFAGPQFDLLTNARFEELDLDGEIKDNDIGGTAGVEIWLHRNIALYGRYMLGNENINESNPTVALLSTTITSEMKNEGWQVGLNLGFRGKAKPKDADADGIEDKSDKCPAEPGVAAYSGCPIPDTDADGINDEVDKCPSQPGTTKYNGCPVPDTDGDGINDDSDKCIDKPGTAKYEGCPVPDTDGDGINDDTDKCIDKPGTAKYEGCPIPDTDSDGINDEVDKCPSVPGVPEMKGCPKIDYKAHGVTFSSSKAILTIKGKQELDKLVAFMTEHQDLKITLVGYTDSTGSDKINEPLSLKRAESAKAYLVEKGIDESRIAVEGRGSANPMADNKSKAGRAENRRIEVEVQD